MYFQILRLLHRLVGISFGNGFLKLKNHFFYFNNFELIAILDAEKAHFLDAFATATPDIRRKTRQTLPISVHPDTVKTAVYIKRLFKVRVCDNYILIRNE